MPGVNMSENGKEPKKKNVNYNAQPASIVKIKNKSMKHCNDFRLFNLYIKI